MRLDDERLDDWIIDDDGIFDIPVYLDVVDGTDAPEFDIGMGEPDPFRAQHTVYEVAARAIEIGDADSV